MIRFTKSLEEFVAKRLEQREEAVRSAYNTCEKDVEAMRRGHSLLVEMSERLPPECLEDHLVLSPYGLESANVRVKKESLPAVREAFGRLEVVGKSLRDAERGEIYVWLRAANRHELRFHYVTTVEPGDPCRIVEVPVPARRELVCEVPKEGGAP